MRNLEEQANNISLRYDEHSEQLRKAQSGADQILRILDTAAASASTLTSSFSSAFAIQGWWPYIYCPAASLLMGSYGLPPSAVRNIALFGIGEIAGFFLSNISNILSSFRSFTISGFEVGHEATNATSFHEAYWAEAELINNDLRKRRHTRDF